MRVQQQHVHVVNYETQQSPLLCRERVVMMYKTINSNLTDDENTSLTTQRVANCVLYSLTANAYTLVV